MIDIQSVRHALLVSEHLSIRRAAAELGLRPSAVSRRLQSLARNGTRTRVLTAAPRRSWVRRRPDIKHGAYVIRPPHA